MSEAVEAATREHQGTRVPEPAAGHIKEALADLLKSSPFRSSKQSQQLLSYIVKQTLSGNGELLKERVIGIEVFGRRADYDTSTDPIVRSRATEVRRRLAQYYLGEGVQASIRIEILPGSYHASFSASHAQDGGLPLNGGAQTEMTPIVAANPPAPTRDVSMAPPGPARKHRLLSPGAALLLLAAVALIAVVALFWMPEDNAINQFWGPLFSGAKPLLVYTGSIQVNNNAFVNSGDLAASAQVVSLFSRHRQKFDLRTGNDITFDDFRQAPAVLVGCLNNPWTLLLNDNLRFICTDDKGPIIEERTGAHRHWTSMYSKDGKVQTDYAVVSRLITSKMGQPLIVIAGIADSGTRAAAEFITNRQRVKQLTHSLPKGWKNKSMQFVLETKVVNGTPATSTVVAVGFL